MIALTASRLFTPLECVPDPLLLVEDGVIVEVASRAARQIPARARVLDFGEGILAPGLVDLHIHGSAGHDVMDAAPSALPAVEQFLAKHGVSSYFPTTVTAPLDQTLAALDRLANAIEAAQRNRNGGLRACPVGIHLEGPFLSHARRGVHPPQNLLRPSISTFEKLWQAARGHIRIMTIAPELDGALEVVAEAARRGVCVSLGHSDADTKATRAAIAAGARHATHTFNAMRPLDHREPGILGAALTDSRLTADIIADGVHVDPTVVELFLRAKGAEAAVLITDATAATGMPDGHYRLGTIDVEVKDGRCLSDGHLAGSVLTLDRAVRNIMQFTRSDLQSAVRLATLNPARVAGLTKQGRLEAGAAADIAVLSPAGEVRATMIRGEITEPVSKVSVTKSGD
jgi:N-acetylglucosamine-6-phosphate deacetylase